MKVMMSEDNPKTAGTDQARLSFSADESRHAWLGMLLEAYHIIDKGVAEGIRREELQGRTLACCKGCAACCRSHKTIPVYPLELAGMTWYATEKLKEPLRSGLRNQLENHRELDSCPFLVGDVCSVHPLRPVACRQFYVFGRVCMEGEDAFYTRRNDVLTPFGKYTDAAFDVMLPFYGVEKKAERKKAIKEGAMHQVARIMNSLNWASLAEKMDAFDRNNKESDSG